ncbi:hypothetical protein H0H92_010568, partial [Tricholoma furcatifolium]
MPATRRTLRSDGPVDETSTRPSRKRTTRQVKAKTAAGSKSRPQPRKVKQSGANRDAIGTDESFLSNRRWAQGNPKQSNADDERNAEEGTPAPDKGTPAPDKGTPAPLEVPETPIHPRTPTRDPAPPQQQLSSGSSGSDFSADQNRKRAEFEKCYAKRANRPRTEEENDLSDEEHFIEETLHAQSRASSRASRLSEEDQEDKEDNEDDEEDNEDDEEDNEDDGEGGVVDEDDEEHGGADGEDNGGPDSYKTGPVPADIQERAHALYKTFQEEMHSLAKECNKSPDVLFSLVGHGPA